VPEIQLDGGDHETHWFDRRGGSLPFLLGLGTKCARREVVARPKFVRRTRVGASDGSERQRLRALPTSGRLGPELRAPDRLFLFQRFERKLTGSPVFIPSS
jgi:hypothetical protein